MRIITVMRRHWRKKVRLQGKCQLAELPSAGVSWETDDNGFVVKASSKQMKVDYRYDEQGYPLGKTTVSNDKNVISHCNTIN